MLRNRLCHVVCAALLCSLGLSTTALAQTPALRNLHAPGALPLHVYPPGAYPGKPSNWGMTTSSSGAVFIGNETGVFAVRGAHMSGLIPVANHSIVRGVAQGPDGHVYVGGSNELGVLLPDAAGTLRYASLLKEIPEADRDFQDVWQVMAYGEDVFFCTNRQLMRWTPARREMKVWRFSAMIGLVKGAESPVVQHFGDGTLLHLEGADWRPFMSAPAILKEETAHLMVPRVAGDSLVVTERAMYRMSGGTLRGVASALDTMATRTGVYGASLLPGGYFAIGTLYDGALILDSEGALVRRISKAEGLPDNVVLAVEYDGNGNLWLCLERGLVRIELDSGVTLFGEREGLQADALALARHGSDLYLGGLRQLAQMPRTPGTPLADLFTPDDDVLGLYPTPQGLLVGMTEGVRVFRAGRIEDIPGLKVEGDYTATFLRSRVDTTRLYVGYRRGLAILRLDRGQWVFADTVAQVQAFVTGMAEAADGSLWLGSTNEDLWRVSFGAQATHVTRFGAEHGMPQLTVTPVRIEDQIVIYTPAGFYRPRGNRIVPDSSALAALFDYAPRDISALQVGDDGVLWMIVDDAPGMARPTESGYRWEPLPDRVVQRSAAREIWHVDGATWVSQTNRLVRLQTGAKPETAFATHLVSVRHVQRDSVLYGGFGPVSAPNLTNRSGVHFAVSTPFYDGVQYRYRLDGFDEQWSAWTDAASHEYSTLQPGQYVFRAQSRSRHGQLSEEATYAFSILPPWYATLPMLGLYVLLSLLIVGLCVVMALRWQRNRTETGNRMLEEEVHARTREAEAQKKMLRHLNSTLKDSNARLQELSEQKSRLLSIAAHDLKTPLANIYSLADLLLEERHEGPPNYEFVELIHTSARQMSDLIDDVLSSSAAEAGKVGLHRRRVDFAEMAGQVVRQCTIIAERKEQRIDIEVSPQEAGFEIEADEMRITEVMTNLLSNAVKYSPVNTRIQVRVERLGEAVSFAVQDQGPGLSEADREQLFQPFQRLSAQPTGGESSSGMGLYIVQQYVQMHGGTVGVETVPGMGSVFSFWLPVRPGGVTPRAMLAHAGPGNPA